MHCQLAQILLPLQTVYHVFSAIQELSFQQKTTAHIAIILHISALSIGSYETNMQTVTSELTFNEVPKQTSLLTPSSTPRVLSSATLFTSIGQQIISVYRHLKVRWHGRITRANIVTQENRPPPVTSRPCDVVLEESRHTGGYGYSYGSFRWRSTLHRDSVGLKSADSASY